MGGAAERALDELAVGGLRGPAAGAWQLVDRAWPVLSSRVAVFQRVLGVQREYWDDCGQEALLRVWRARTSYRGTQRVELLAWLFRIVEREHLRLVEARGRAVKNASDLSLEHDQRDEGDPVAARATTGGNPTAESAVKNDALHALAGCLDRLRPQARRVIELLYSRSSPTEREVAAVIGVSKSQVHALRKASLAALARCLGSEEDQP